MGSNVKHLTVGEKPRTKTGNRSGVALIGTAMMVC
jgi:hypothetical protein